MHYGEAMFIVAAIVAQFFIWRAIAKVVLGITMPYHEEAWRFDEWRANR
jgi:hypothetical protein